MHLASQAGRQGQSGGPSETGSGSWRCGLCSSDVIHRSFVGQSDAVDQPSGSIPLSHTIASSLLSIIKGRS